MKPQLMTEEALAAVEARVNGFTHAEMEKHYAELTKARDAVYAKTAPIQAQLDKATADAEAARVKAQELVDKIENLWGADWLATKKEIGLLANRMQIAKKLGLVK